MSANKKRTGSAVARASAVSTSIAVSGGKSSASKGESYKMEDSDDSSSGIDERSSGKGFGNLKWVHCCHGSIPEFPVSGRDDKRAPDMFVGRTKHDRQLIPGEVIPRDGCIYVTGCEYKYEEYEVLANPEHYTLNWVHSRGGDIHPRAIPGGYDRSGETYYIGRHMHKGHFALGKVRPADHRCFILFEGKDYDYKEFEVLVCSEGSRTMPKKGVCVPMCDPGIRSLIWIPGRNGSIPEYPVYCRDDRDAPDMIVGRTWHNTEVIPGAVMPSEGCVYVAIFSSDNRHEEYEVLTNPKKYKLSWVDSKSDSIHPRAVPGGYAKQGISHYIGRRKHEGHMIVGKVQPTMHKIWVTYGGKEYGYHDYEVLICES